VSGVAVAPATRDEGLAGIPARISGLSAAPLLLPCLGFALLWRAPGLLHTELNMDEALYRLIGQSLAEGHAPYVEYWDRKPVGTFLITALIHLGLGESLAAFRLIGALFVGVTAWLLALAGRALFPALPLAGTLGAFFYILFCVRNGGEGTNTELLFAPFGLAGLLCLIGAAQAAGGGRIRRSLAGGLCFGTAIQIKQFAAFDAIAFCAIYLILATAKPGGWRPWTHFGAGFAVVLGALLPTLLVLGWYLAIGRLDVWVEANIGANLGLVGTTAPALNLEGLGNGLRDFDLLVLGAALALVAGPLLPAGRGAWRGILALWVWLTAMALCLLVSRRFADHFFLQLLPILALASGLGLALLWQAAAVTGPRRARWAALGLLGVLLLVGARGAMGPFHAAAETLWRRHVMGVAQWGDRSATLAATIADRVEGPGDVYVFGRWLGVHGLTGTRPPTRFPFALHLFAEYAPVDGATEMARILAARPRFIIVETRWLAGAPPRGAEAAAVFAILKDSLARDYVREGEVGLFRSWRGGAVGGMVDATLFRRQDVPASAAPPRVQLHAGA
jgi:hypothetical protein